MSFPSSSQGRAGSSVAALALLASVFFMWGFATVLNDILVPHLKATFSLNYTASLLVQSCFYLGYLVISLPASRLVSALGYKGAVILGLVGMAVSCLIFIQASAFSSCGFFLVVLFLFAAAIILLQAAANPYVVLIGDEGSASSRLNIVQALNAFGTRLAPLFGGVLIFACSHVTDGADRAVETISQRMQDAQMVQLPYALIAAVLLLMAAIVWRFPLPAIAPGENKSVNRGDKRSIWRHRNLFRGGALAGRFLGAFLMRRISPHLLLVLASLSGACLFSWLLLRPGILPCGRLSPRGCVIRSCFP